MDRSILQRFDLTGGEMLLNMGPQHPSTHGVINFVIQADGEVMQKAVPEVGYLHRGMEKIAEGMTWAGFMPFTDRIDYLGAMFANQGYAMAVERLLGVEVPRRAEHLRVLACELNRIASHLIGLGSMALDLGASTPFTHAIREREAINDLTEELCGARLTYNYARVGGVSHDIPSGFDARVKRFLDRFLPFVDEFDRLITRNEIFVKRSASVAVITAAEAIAHGLAGPNLRASGVDWDLRRDEPYSVYPEMEFDVPLGRGERGVVGDCYDRFVVRVEEMRQSARIVRQALGGLPAGDIQAKVPRKIKPAPGSCYAAVESARGEMGFYVVSDGGPEPYRVKIRCGSFTAMTIIEHKSPGLMIADLVALFASLDVVAPEVDR